MRWSAIAASEPTLGTAVFDSLIRPGVLLVVPSGVTKSPRISGAAAEVKVRGTVRAEQDHDVQRRYAAAVSAQIGWRPIVVEFALLVVDVEDVTYIGYDADTSGQHVARWPAGRTRPAVGNAYQPRSAATCPAPARLTSPKQAPSGKYR